MRAPTDQVMYHHRFHPYSRARQSRYRVYSMASPEDDTLADALARAINQAYAPILLFRPSFTRVVLDLAFVKKGAVGLTVKSTSHDDNGDTGVSPLLGHTLNLASFDDDTPTDTLAMAIYSDYVPGLRFKPPFAKVVVHLARLLAKRSVKDDA